jgi:hypothetical protein
MSSLFRTGLMLPVMAQQECSHDRIQPRVVYVHHCRHSPHFLRLIRRKIQFNLGPVHVSCIITHTLGGRPPSHSHIIHDTQCTTLTLSGLRLIDIYKLVPLRAQLSKGDQVSVFLVPSSHTKRLESAFLVDKLKWRALLDENTLVHHQNLATWHNCLPRQSEGANGAGMGLLEDDER